MIRKNLNFAVFFSDMLGLTPADCLVMGDGENDLEMLRNVASAGGVAVAVGNAVPSLKAVASYVSLKVLSLALSLSLSRARARVL